MKQEQLLEAIGYVEETLLQEPTHRVGRRIWRTVLVAALMAALAVTAAAVGSTIFKSGSNTMDNILTGSGRFAYDDGHIYYGSVGTIYELDLQTGKTKALPLSDSQADPKYLIATEAGLGYVTDFNTLKIMAPDGTTQQVLMEDGDCARLFVDGNMLYTENGLSLQRVNMDTGAAAVLAENTHGYYVDETYLYALVEGNVFLRSGKDTIIFEEIPLSFHPAGVIADGDDLYFSEYQKNGTYQVIHYRNGTETRLPVCGYFMQVLEEHLICLDNQTLKSYDLTTGEIAVIAENVYEFSVLEDRYICIDRFNDSCLVLDCQTGQRTAFGK